jgi:hypothetical protein
MTRAKTRDLIARLVAPLFGAAALCSAGCDKGYDVSITVDESVNSACNTSCVKSFLVVAFGRTSETFECYPATMPTLREHGMSGKIDLAVPEDFAGVWVSAWSEEECVGAPVGEGVAAAADGELKVTMTCTASCSSRSTMNLQITNVVDVAKGTCDGGGVKPNRVAAGILRPLEMGKLFPASPSYAEFYPVASSTASLGTASVQGLGGAGSLTGCSAAALYRDGTPTNVACLRPAAPGGVCADAGKTEVPYFPGAPTGEVTDGFKVIGVFARRNAATPTPIANAVVAVSPAASARIEYLELVGDALQPNPALRATNATGAFAIYTWQPVAVTVTAGNERSTRMMGGGDIFTSPGAAPLTTVGAQIFTPD